MSSRISELKFSVSIATVVHTKQYAKFNVRGLNIGSGPQTQVVFKLAQSQEDLKVNVENTNVPFRVGQEFGIVSVGHKIVAYVDMVTKNYSYST